MNFSEFIFNKYGLVNSFEAKKKKWIKKAIKKPGALRKQLKIKKGKTIPIKTLRKAARSKNKKLARRARLALTLRKLRKKKKK